MRRELAVLVARKIVFKQDLFAGLKIEILVNLELLVLRKSRNAHRRHNRRDQRISPMGLDGFPIVTHR